jgi:hypothetical protein
MTQAELNADARAIATGSTSTSSDPEMGADFDQIDIKAQIPKAALTEAEADPAVAAELVAWLAEHVQG